MPHHPRNRPKPEVPAGSGLRRVARAADALRAGGPVRFAGSEAFTMLAAEVLDDAAIVRMRRAGAYLVLSHTRARTLKIRLYTPQIVALRLTAEMDAARIRAIADPTADLATPLKGPFEAVRELLPEAFAASVKLAKLAGLLPAAIVRRAGRAEVSLAVRDILCRVDGGCLAGNVNQAGLEALVREDVDVVGIGDRDTVDDEVVGIQVGFHRAHGNAPHA